MQLWIMQDILRAIALTNQVQSTDVNVTTAPIKRLISLAILPDYVGITGQGGIQQDGPGAVGATRVSRGGPVAPPPSGPPGMPGMMGAPPGGPNRAGPRGGNAGHPAVDKKLADDFTLSPTGRRSNDIYDVRHVWLSVVIDSQRMPEFFDNLAQVNFMTVLKMKISDEDEYKAAEQGYVYGACDAVRVDMLIETLWLRDWTTKWMPGDVRTMLDVTEASAR
jgi:hypothetical protein